ncbi:uncharacterized protein LOC127004062 isoform X2 [Eriocheir sinensis]|nr:uncharacterized protein LOC127004062 isoform X2 [Eriocheir sinensis]
MSCALLAIPEESVPFGNIMVHQGAARHIPDLKLHRQLCVKKIDCVSYVDELTVTANKTFTNNEKSFFEKQVKAFVYSSFPLGAPFTMKVGSKIHLPSHDNNGTTFTVQGYKLSDSFYDSELSNYGQDADNEGSVTIPSQLLTIDECEGSLASVTDKVSKLQISSPYSLKCPLLEETGNGSKFAVNLITSTPKRTVSCEESEHSGTLSSKINSKEISVIKGSVTDTGSYSLHKKTTSWVRTGMNTKVILQQVCDEKADFCLLKVNDKNDYCKETTYYTLKKIMEAALTGSGITGSALLGRWSGVMLFGPPGTGKTSMVHQVAAELDVPLFMITQASVSESSRTAKEHVQFTFAAACKRAPSVLFLDEVESLCPAADHKSQADKVLTPTILQGIQTLQTSPQPVFLVAATCQPTQVATKLRSPGRLERELMVPLPDARQRERIFQQLMSAQRHDLTNHDITSLARKAYGFSGADLSVLVRCAWLACVKRTKEKEELRLSRGDICDGMQNIVPAMLRHNYSAVSMVKWQDIWGYENIKTKLQTIINLHSSDPEKHPLKGVLLYGPPGCSKTMFVRALVHETSYSFFPLKCSNLLSKYVGETEKSLSQVFVRAQQASPSVVFMDEVDSLCGERGGDGGLVSELLTLMAQKGVQRRVMVIGATNRPHAVDEALLRPGFFEQVIHVDLPDHESRYAIWTGLLRNVPQEGSVCIPRLSEATEGYSGAEITAVYQEAAMAALEEYIKESNNKPGLTVTSPCPVTINEDLLMRTIATLPPRTPPSLLKAILTFSRQRKDLRPR